MLLQNYRLLFEFMEILGKKWAVPLLVFLLLYEETTFTNIKKHLKITSRSLSKKLKLLEMVGLVKKIVVQNPTRVVYSLSDMGKEISEVVLRFGTTISKQKSL